MGIFIFLLSRKKRRLPPIRQPVPHRATKGLSAVPVIFPEFRRRNPYVFDESLVKMALRIKADHTRNLRDRIIGGNQERLCFPDFTAQRVLHWGIAQHILEGMGHIGLTQPEVPADILDGNWLAVMLVNIFLDPLP